MVALTGTFSRIKSYKAIVFGDVMLDTYTMGSVKRVSPEAPVTVLNVEKENSLPGGAGNVALNLCCLGGTVRLSGRIGEDLAGQQLRQELTERTVDATGLVTQAGLPTPVKQRLIASNQQLIRVDMERIAALDAAAEQAVVDQLPALLAGQDVVAISDYAKGFLTPSLLQSIITAARERSIPVIVDPKRGNYGRYKGATVVKPNESEAYEAAGLDREAPLEAAAEYLLRETEADYLLITRSQHGIAIFSRSGERQDFPVMRIREVNDVTGAGDTVLATLACALANHISIQEAARLANVAAGLAVEQLGCACITLTQLATRLLELDTGNKIFSQDQLFVLDRSLRYSSYVLVGMKSTDELSTAFFHNVRELHANGQREVIVFLEDPTPNEDFIQFLASLNEINFIIVKSAALGGFPLSNTPETVYRMSNGDMTQLSSLEALLNG